MEFGNGMHKIEIKGEPIYLKKSKIPLIGGWTVIAPWKDETGEIKWFNLLTGGKQNLLFVLLFLFVVAFMWWSFQDLRGQMAAIVADPCAYCRVVGPVNITKAPIFTFNVSVLDDNLKDLGGENDEG